MKGTIIKTISNISYLYKELSCLGSIRVVILLLLNITILRREKNVEQLRRKLILCALRNIVKPIIKKHEKNDDRKICHFSNDSIIFVCWLQGEQEMPPIVKRCYNSLIKNKGNYRVKLITWNNLNDYISIPLEILQKVYDGRISYTHFSDIIRCALLAKFGGLWIDSTYWVTKPLNLNDYLFYSLKQEDQSETYLSKSRWTGNCIGTGNPYYIFSFIYECLILYDTKFDKLVDYYLLDYFIKIAYECFDDFAKIIDNLPLRCPNISIMQNKFYEKFDESTYQELIEHNEMFKLTYKKDFPLSVDGEETYFNVFMNS